MATYSPIEKQYFDQLFTIIDKDDAGVLPGQDALPFLTTSNLPHVTLGEIWALADPDNNGFLTRDSWYRAARLIGWMQKGGQAKVDESLALKPGPLPTFAGHPPPPAVPLSASNTGAGSAASVAPMAGASLPPLTPADRTKFTRIFVGCGPSNGLVSGDKARDVFLKSQLSYDKLGQIWSLADTQQRGALDLADFIVGMHLIQSCMANSSLALPASLPPGLYEAASGGRAQPRGGSPAPASPIQRQFTGSALQPQRTGQSVTGVPGTPTRQGSVQFASPSMQAPPPQPSFLPPSRQASGAQQPWDVTPQAKATSDQFFAQLDTANRGFIDGDVAVPFMLQSQLDEASLATVWDLSDIRQEGRLDRDEFAVAMHLINAKLAGQDLPTKLPNSLIPPALRAQYGAGGQEVLAAPQPSAARDLFDLMGDDTPAPAPPVASPPPVQAQSPPPQAAFLPQPPSRRGTAPIASRQLSPVPTGQAQAGFGMAPFAPSPAPSAPAPASDLLGDDGAEAAPASRVPDNSAELGNMQNELSNKSRAVADLEKQHGELEQQAASSGAQLAELEAKLSVARSRHATETKAVADLRLRVGEQAAKVKQLEAETISAESDLTAMRMEKDELEQALLRDKEEVRGLQRRMKEVEDEKTGMRLLLDKVRKEARQQKGLVSIAKKQLSTAEGARDGVQQEIRQAEQEVEDAKKELAEIEAAPAPAEAALSPGSAHAAATTIPLPATPLGMSPQPTGASARSNNPFDRLGRGASAPRSAPSPSSETGGGLGIPALAGAGAAVGAAAGVVAAGATTLFEAAKEAVTGEHDEHDAATPKAAEPAADTQEAHVADVDPFGAPAHQDPFGASPAVDQGAFDSTFDSGFGDSFAAKPVEGVDAAPAAATTSAPTDFDSAFADFDEPKDVAEPAQDGATEHLTEAALAEEAAPPSAAPQEISAPPIPSGIPKSAIPADLRPDVERSLSTVAVAPSSTPATPTSERDASFEATPTAPAEPTFEPSPLAETTAVTVPAVAEHEGDSSDEEEGPEDLDGPRRVYQSPTTAEAAVMPAEAAPSVPSTELAPPLVQPTAAPSATETTSPVSPAEEPKVRRSAPPPPPARTSIPAPAAAPVTDDFDPFGAPVASTVPPAQASEALAAGSLPPGAAPAQPGTATFDDDDDFDFSDLPPAQVEPRGAPTGHAVGAPAASSMFDDEFAGFDDDFEQPSSQAPSGSDNSNANSHGSHTFEMVSPQVAQGEAALPAAGASAAPHGSTYDAWGISSHSKGTSSGDHSRAASGTHGAPAPAMSFDDAFGGDFEPAQIEEETYAPPPGPPPGHSAAAAAPPADGPQEDDLEDVKKLCAMGFPRSLVVEALAANNYDLQKTINVLLVK